MRIAILAAVLGLSATVGAAPPNVEDLLRGQLIVSDQPLPRTSSSATGHAAKLRQLRKPVLWFSPVTRAVTVHYAAFLARPVEVDSLELVVYDVSVAVRKRISSFEIDIARGKRTAYGTVVLRALDFPPDRTYRLAVELRRSELAAGTVRLRDRRRPRAK